MAENHLSQFTLDISQGAPAASFQGSLTTADGKTKIIQDCEGKDGGVK